MSLIKGKFVDQIGHGALVLSVPFRGSKLRVASRREVVGVVTERSRTPPGKQATRSVSKSCAASPRVVLGIEHGEETKKTSKRGETRERLVQ
ncbi:hypothetical protein CK516_12220 [Nostoc sp. 'Peltigera malacea cyanobiont' DB3992]|nr:hypothetical protein CK516_12220 [Nostoc sp. 'Peltigera malacea cyanobiont' DB3992]